MYNGEQKEIQSGDTVAGVKEVISRGKEGTESVASSATLQDDDDFSFTLKANTKYVISGNLRISAGASSGFKAAWSLPSGASGRFSVIEDASGAIINNVDAATGSGQTATLAVSNVCVIFGYILTSSTAGNAVFRWAQNASNASATAINQCSTMNLSEC